MKKRIVSFQEYDWEVRMVRADSTNLDGARGITDYNTSRIYIANNLSNITLKQTLIHELTHAALYDYDHSADDTTSEINFKNEEELCRFMEVAMCEIYEQAMEIYNDWKRDQRATLKQKIWYNNKNEKLCICSFKYKK